MEPSPTALPTPSSSVPQLPKAASPAAHEDEDFVAPKKKKKDKGQDDGDAPKRRKLPETDSSPSVSPLVKAAAADITALYSSELSSKLTYHSIRHTEAVVKESRALALAAGLNAEDTETLLLAAWFHDTGYLDVYDGHEFRSMERAAQWLGQHGVSEARSKVIQGMIKATHRDHKPGTELEKLLVDADMSNLAREDFMSSAELLRTEWEIALGKTYTTPEWAELQLNFMMEHKYHSEAGKERYKEAFRENTKEQRKALKKTEKKSKKREKELTGTFAEPKRGIETMFRTMYSNHMKLSDMADKKASMMISLNAVLMSVIITYLGARTSTLGPAFTRNPILAVPMGILLLTSLASVVTAILSAQPDVTSFKWLKRSPQVATNRRVNLLFFGNFTKLSLDDFQSGIRELMRGKDALYTNMATDVYYLGDVLAKKYGLLRNSYTIFMVGLILTVLSFAIVLLYKS